MRNLEERFNSSSPFTRFSFHTVTFADADTDTLVEHDLAPLLAEDVRYVVLGLSAASSIYHDQSTTRRLWERDGIYLRASAPVTAELLLVLPTETT